MKKMMALKLSTLIVFNICTVSVGYAGGIFNDVPKQSGGPYDIYKEQMKAAERRYTPAEIAAISAQETAIKNAQISVYIKELDATPAQQAYLRKGFVEAHVTQAFDDEVDALVTEDKAKNLLAQNGNKRTAEYRALVRKAKAFRASSAANTKEANKHITQLASLIGEAQAKDVALIRLLNRTQGMRLAANIPDFIKNKLVRNFSVVSALGLLFSEVSASEVSIGAPVLESTPGYNGDRHQNTNPSHNAGSSDFFSESSASGSTR